MIQFSTAPWQVDATHSGINDSTGRPVVYVSAPHLCDEEKATILRAIASLPQIMEFLAEIHRDAESVKARYIDAAWQNNQEFIRLTDTLKQIFAYILPIEQAPEVLTNRWLHALQQPATGTPAEAQALRNLTLSLSDRLNGDMSGYPAEVQQAFQHAMQVLNGSKQMQYEPEATA